MDHGDILLNLFLGTEIEGGPTNLYLRMQGLTQEATPLLGPRSRSHVRAHERGLNVSGEWQGIRYDVTLVLAQSASAWFWHVLLLNTLDTAKEVDLIYVQDLALAHYGAVRMNEYYTSHYVDHTPLSHPKRGFVLASRQNLSMGGHYPWTIIGSLGMGSSYATDTLQFYGLAVRAGEPPVGLAEGLPGARFQHEHSMAAVQEAPLRLEPGSGVARGFFGWFESDHPAASSAGDLLFVEKALELPEALPPPSSSAPRGLRTAPTLFTDAPVLNTLDLTEDEIAGLYSREIREVEREEGKVLSFFSDTHRHVVLKAKELKVLRPHAHILRTGNHLVPDEASLTSTSWMGGVFHSMLTQGHVSINRFLSATHGYLGLFRGNGQRLFAELNGGWHLLDVPSAYEMTPQSCSWLYKHANGCIVVRSEASTSCHELTLSVEVLEGSPVRFLLSNHVAMNGDDGSEAVPVRNSRDGDGLFVETAEGSDVGRRFPGGGFRIKPLPGTIIEQVGGDELLFLDGRSRRQPYLCMLVAPSLSIAFRIKGCLIPETGGKAESANGSNFWHNMTAGLRLHPPVSSPLAGATLRLPEILPWFVHNALVHYLAPRGLEQYTGGGWGTRDICQGPVEMLLALSRYKPINDLLCRVFKAQNPGGDWPQWFTFFDRERNIRADDSHGDIVFWPVLALAEYLTATEDAGLLDKVVPFFHPEGEQRAEHAPVWQHVERALSVMRSRVIPGTRLAAYGHGDWNDSMQPFDQTMRERLCSAWTVTLNYQALAALASALHRLHRVQQAAQFEAEAEEIRKVFQQRLMVDETLAGFAYFHDSGQVDYLLHPRDGQTGLSYSLLPMIHAIINGLLSREQAQKHLTLIESHLRGPDGARLFDRAMPYRGGPQRHFQRAESAAFFGREIGLMYTHAHLRYAEALAYYGEAEGFFTALCQANPVGIRRLVPAATLRQANCYYSSSDAVFADRYLAFIEYDRVKKGEIPLDGGWRVYSSGPGIWTRLFLHSFLGLRRGRTFLLIDPVIPASLDGMRVEMEWEGRKMEITYRIRENGCGPTKMNLNGTELPFSRCAHPYRTGAAEVPMVEVGKFLKAGTNKLTVHIA